MVLGIKKKMKLNIQQILKYVRFYNGFYANKFENLSKIHRFLESINYPNGLNFYSYTIYVLLEY